MITVNCTGLPASHIESEQRLKRVFHIHFETCAHCHGPVKIIAAIDDPEVSHKILTHLAEKASANPCEHFPERRAPSPALGGNLRLGRLSQRGGRAGRDHAGTQPPMSARAHVQRTEDIRRRPIPAEGLRLVTQRKRKRADHDVGRQIGFGGRGFYTSYTPPKDDPSIDLLESAGHNTTTVRE